MLMRNEEKWLESWPRIRSKGKARYIVTRGLLRGLLIYLVWAAVTWFWDRERFSPEHFMDRYYIYFVLFLLYGFLISASSWKGNNMKYDNLIKHGKAKKDTSN
ncbi:hypothetical protein ABDI30_16005 [Paenibacillus cisolokensis]|uniref:hypothetical protein n=1 Tax=Paenibacillus cisolokensis TaxID=1658519 RepID=UPI003D2E322A